MPWSNQPEFYRHFIDFKVPKRYGNMKKCLVLLWSRNAGSPPTHDQICYLFPYSLESQTFIEHLCWVPATQRWTRQNIKLLVLGRTWSMRTSSVPVCPPNPPPPFSYPLCVALFLNLLIFTPVWFASKLNTIFDLKRQWRWNSSHLTLSTENCTIKKYTFFSHYKSNTQILRKNLENIENNKK